MTEQATAAPEGGVDESIEAPAESNAEEVEPTADENATGPEAEGEEDASPDADEQEGEGDDEESTEGDEDEAPSVELNFGGNKVSIPANATAEEAAAEVQKFADNIWGDYTRKSQDVSEKAKSLEARSSAVERLAELNGEALEAYSRGQHLQREIEQLERVDLRSLWQSEPDRARQISDAIQHKRAEFTQVVGAVNAKEAELNQHKEAEMARLRSEGEAVLERQIKGFKAEKLPIVIDYAVNTLGMDQKTAESDWALNPAITQAVYKAALWDRAQDAAKKSRPKPAKAKPVKPRKGGTGGKSAPDIVKDADKMSPEEWLNHRNRQLGLKG